MYQYPTDSAYQGGEGKRTRMQHHQDQDAEKPGFSRVRDVQSKNDQP